MNIENICDCDDNDNDDDAKADAASLDNKLQDLEIFNGFCRIKQIKENLQVEFLRSILASLLGVKINEISMVEISLTSVGN